MDQESQKVLDSILVKQPHELTDADRAFLKARWHYVGKKSRAKFVDHLELKEQPVVPDEQDDEEETDEQAESEKKTESATDPLAFPGQVSADPKQTDAGDTEDLEDDDEE